MRGSAELGRTKPVRLHKAAAVASVVLMAMAGLSVASIHGAGAQPEIVLRIGFMDKVDSLNPMIGLREAADFFYSLVYDSLQCVDEDLQPSPNLATSWRIVPESDPALVLSGEPYGSVWQYNITRDATWHDGRAFDADDVVFTINMNCQNIDAMWAYQPYAYFMQYAEKVGNDSVRIHFFDRATGEPMPAAYGDLLSISILPEHMLYDKTAYDISFNWTGIFSGEDPPLVGTGPFMATEDLWEEWIHGDKVTLVRNPNYHGYGAVGARMYIDKLVLMFYDDPTAMRLALQVREIDIAQYPAPVYSVIDQDVASGELKNVMTYDGPKLTGKFDYVSFNVNGGGLWGGPGPNPSIWDPDIRRALSMATNKSYVVEEFYGGYADEGSTLISPALGDWHYEPSEDERLAFDIDSANELLDSAGYVDLDADGIREATNESYAVEEGLVSYGSPLEYELLIRHESLPDKDIAMYLAEAWSEIGVELDYRVYTGWMLYSLCPYDSAMGLSSLVSDPDPNLLLFAQSRRAWGGWSDNRYDSQEYNENYNLSVRTLDPDDRREYVYNCQREHYEDAVYLVLAYPHQTYAWRNDTFTDELWGDWTAHPGRSLDNIWGAHPLWSYQAPEPYERWTLTTVQKAAILGAVLAVIAVEAVLIWRKYRKPVPPKQAG